MKKWIVPLALSFLLTSCTSPVAPKQDQVQNFEDVITGPQQSVDPMVKKQHDVEIFVHNNSKNLVAFAMRFAATGNLTKEINNIVSSKAGDDLDGWKIPEFLQPNDLKEIYESRNGVPIFISNSDVSEKAQPIVDELMRIDSHGLGKLINVKPWQGALEVLKNQKIDNSDFEFTEEEEQTIVKLIIERNIDVSKNEAVRDLVTELVRDEKLMPRLHNTVVDRAMNGIENARYIARADVMLADLSMRFAREMAFNNMTHLTEEEESKLSRHPKDEEYARIAAARTRTWMNNLVAIMDAPAPELKAEAPESEAPAPDDDSGNDGNAAAPQHLDDEGEDVTDAGIDEAVDAHAAEIEAANAMKERMQNAQTVKELVDALYPSHPGYAQLMQARDKYASMPDWEEITSTSLKKGKNTSVVPALRKRLAAEGYFHGNVDDPSDVYDDSMIEAVKFYHEAHQLAYDIEKGPQKQFWQSLNTPRETRVQQIEENLRRWHKTQLIPSPYYIYVNVPDFHGEVWRNGERVYRFPVVTGNARKACDYETRQYIYINATPLMHARMLYIEYNPYWIVPPRIEQEDYIKKINSDPNWLRDHGFEYHTEAGRTVLRQLPSEKNALGRVKFIFPNPHSTFLHDSPQKGLFKYPIRAFSHGCMRVWEPLKLAKLLLQYDGQWKERLTKDIDDMKTRRFMLRERFDVFIDYFTVRVDDNGIVYFLADPYHYVMDALDPPKPSTLKCSPKKRTSIVRARGDVGADEP